MSEPNGSGRRIVCPPVLLIADDFLRADILRGDIEELGLKVHVVPVMDPFPAGSLEVRFSLAIFSIRALTDRERRIAAELRAADPRIPILVLHGENRPDLSIDPGPFAGALLLDRRDRFLSCRAAIFSILGVADSDESGTTIPGR